MRIFQTALLGLLALGVQGSLSAALVTGVSVTTSVPDVVGRVPDRIVNNSGLSGVGAGTVFAAGVHDTSGNTQWLGATGGFPVTVTFDLGSVQDLDALHIWNANTSVDRGVNEFDILVSPDSDVGNLTFLGSFTLAEGPTSASYAGVGFNLSSFALANTVRLVRFNITSNYGNDSRIALSEVQFNAVAVPEPSAFILTSMASLGLSFVGQRRRNRVTA